MLFLPTWFLLSSVAAIVSGGSLLGSLAGRMLHPIDTLKDASETTAAEALNLIGFTPTRILNDVILPLFPPVNESFSLSDLLSEWGYPSEAHYVTTEDGYRLRLDRIPNEGRQPVYLAHGLQASFPSFLILGPNRALGTMLYDAVFDVWIIHFRGTEFSQEHLHYTTEDEDFWKFSWHEHGVYDNTAAIDYVLQHTRYEAVLFTSFSMGGATFLTMASVRPDYCKKVRAAFLMAPAGPLHHHSSPMVGVLYPVRAVLQARITSHSSLWL